MKGLILKDFYSLKVYVKTLLVMVAIYALLGIFTGYVMWHPFANKLKRISAEEVEMKKMVLEGALALQSGASSIAMEAKLQSFIPLSQRKSLRDEG